MSLAADLRALGERATPGPYDTTMTGLVRALRGDLAIPIFESRWPYADTRVAPAVREASGKVQFRSESEGARIAMASAAEWSNVKLAAALLNNLDTIIAALEAQEKNDA